MLHEMITALYNGCASQDIINLPVISVDRGETFWLDADLTPWHYGSEFCADYGPASVTLTLYDGSAYPPGTYGDPSIDSVLDSVTVQFNLVP
jgi:hypothetical protein